MGFIWDVPMYSHPMGYISWDVFQNSDTPIKMAMMGTVAHIRHPNDGKFLGNHPKINLFQVGELVNYFDLPSLFWRKRILWEVPKHFLGGLHEKGGDPWVRLQDFQPVTGVHNDQLHFGVTRHWRNGSACETGTRFVH